MKANFRGRGFLLPWVLWCFVISPFSISKCFYFLLMEFRARNLGLFFVYDVILRVQGAIFKRFLQFLISRKLLVKFTTSSFQEIERKRIELASNNIQYIISYLV